MVGGWRESSLAEGLATHATGAELNPQKPGKKCQAWWLALGPLELARQAEPDPRASLVSLSPPLQTPGQQEALSNKVRRNK